MLKILKVSKCLRCVFTDVQMAVKQFMSTVTKYAAKIDGHMRHFVAVNNVMHVRALPVLRCEAVYDVWVLAFLKT